MSQYALHVSSKPQDWVTENNLRSTAWYRYNIKNSLNLRVKTIITGH